MQNNFEPRKKIEVKADALLRLSYAIWMAACFTLPWGAIKTVGSFDVSDALFTLSALVSFFGVRQHKQTVSLTWWAVTVLILISGLLGAYASQDPEHNWNVMLMLILATGIWHWSGVRLALMPSFLVRSMVSYILGGAVSALVAMGQVSHLLDVTGAGLVGVDASRAAGLAPHVNDQGGILALALVLGMSIALGRYTKYSSLVAWSTAICGIGLVLSGSVTGMLSAVLGVAVILVVFRVSIGRILIGLVTAAASFTVIQLLQSGLQGADPMSRLFSSTGQNGDISTLDLRLWTMGFAWEAFAKSPFLGVGLDALSGGTFDGVTPVHNVIGRFAYQGGLPLLVALLIAVLDTLRTLRRSENAATKHVLAIGLFTALVFAQTAPIVAHRYFWFPFILIAVAGGMQTVDSIVRNTVAERCPYPRAEVLPRHLSSRVKSAVPRTSQRFTPIFPGKMARD